MQRFYFILCAVFTIAAVSVQHCQSDVAIKPEEAIRHTAQQFVDAYNHGDAKGVADLWTPDGEYAIGHESLKGRQAIVNLYEAFFRTHPGSKMKVNVESVRMLAPTV